MPKTFAKKYHKLAVFAASLAGALAISLAGALPAAAATKATPAYNKDGYQVNVTTVTATISRAKAQACGTWLCSTTAGVTITNTAKTAGAFQFIESGSDNELFYVASGGLQPSGGNTFSPIAISASAANGTYTGSKQLTLYKQGSNNVYYNGPVINYTIKLTN